MSFNPYVAWLGIPESRLPPSHYDLLAIDEAETDLGRIQHAALARVALLRRHQAGKHSDWSQRLLNEVSSARLCLCDPDRRAAYDAHRRPPAAADSELAPAGDPFGAPPPAIDAAEVAAWLADAHDAAPSAPLADASAGPWRSAGWAALATLLILAAAVAGLFWIQSPTSAELAETPADAPAPDTTTPSPLPASPPADARPVTAKPEIVAAAKPAESRKSAPGKPAKLVAKPAKPTKPAAPPADPDANLPSRPWPLAPGQPKLLAALNTEGDELDPCVAGDDRSVWFVRREKAGDRIFRARRRGPGLEFAAPEVVPIAALGADAKLATPTPLPDGAALLFATDAAGGWGIFSALLRPTADNSGRWAAGKPEEVPAFQGMGDDVAIALSRDGGEALVTREGRRARWQLLRAPRLAATTFGDPTPVETAGDYEWELTAGTVARDGLTAYLQGSGETTGSAKRSGLVRLRRPDRNASWGAPELLLPPAGSRYGDLRPTLADDEKVLVFASDRPGGKGDLDLWALPIPPLSADAVARPMARKTRAAKPLPAAQRLNAEWMPWLTLGPIADAAAAEDCLQRFQRGRFPRVGLEDRLLAVPWQKNAAEPNAWPAGYFVAATEVVIREPGPLRLRLADKTADAGFAITFVCNGVPWPAGEDREFPRRGKVRLLATIRSPGRASPSAFQVRLEGTDGAPAKNAAAEVD